TPIIVLVVLFFLVGVPILACIGLVTLANSTPKGDPTAKRPNEQPKPEAEKKAPDDAKAIDPPDKPIETTRRPELPESLDAPETEEIVFLDPDHLAVGLVGEFRRGPAGAARPGTLTAVLDATSLVVTSKGDELVLSGIDTSKQVADKAIFLRGTWEVVGRRKHKGRDLWELTHLVEAAEVATQTESKPESKQPKD